ncbi:acyl carrier protein [Streptomyces sp. N35]|uniref:acyl carrier protein n=1 Tax=Streptomyces sp. N35 TaxID=2795730 RepID=UPI0018F7B3E2|nr:acyl carrier protein [Streptomyces sp. N35]
MTEELIAVLKTELRDVDQLDLDASLEAVGIDSLRIVNLSVRLEADHGIDVSFAELNRIKSLRELDALVQRRLTERGPR